MAKTNKEPTIHLPSRASSPAISLFRSDFVASCSSCDTRITSSAALVALSSDAPTSIHVRQSTVFCPGCQFYYQQTPWETNRRFQRLGRFLALPPAICGCPGLLLLEIYGCPELLPEFSRNLCVLSQISADSPVKKTGLG